MAWMPDAVRKEVTKHRTGITGPRRLVLHTAVSASSSLFNYFNASSTSVCSHFYVRADGTIEQYVSTAYRAPAQLEGNPDSVSVESQDMGDGFPSWSGSNVPAWTDAQVKALARIAAWCNTTHGVALTQLPDSTAGRNGVGYHRLGIDPWRVDGGQTWSSSYGKVCPGDRRVAQVPNVISLAKQIGDDVTAQENWDYRGSDSSGPYPSTMGQYQKSTFVKMNDLGPDVAALANEVASVKATVAEILAAVNALAAGGTDPAVLEQVLNRTRLADRGDLVVDPTA